MERPRRHLSARGCLDHQNDTRFAPPALRRDSKPPPLEQMLSDFDWIEPQQTPDIHVRQARAAEVVNVSHRAAQELRYLINGPEVLGDVGCFSGDFHAQGTASTSTDRQCVECRVNPTIRNESDTCGGSSPRSQMRLLVSRSIRLLASVACEHSHPSRWAFHVFLLFR